MKAFVLGLLLTVALLTSGCMWGFVRDGKTGAGVPGAQVTFIDGNLVEHTVTTNSAGWYALYPAPLGPADTGTIAARISADGYLSQFDFRRDLYDDNPNATLAAPASFWEIQNFTMFRPVSGGRIAFARRHFNTPTDSYSTIDIMSEQGMGEKQLSATGEFSFKPQWSPDGSKIAYLCESGDYSDICVTSPDGRSRRTRITQHESICNFAWSPDGSKIAFESPCNSNDRDIFIVGADGSDLKRLTNDVADSYSPAWSPDGSRIAYSSDYDIYVMNADGSGKRPLNVWGAFEGDPEWSANGDAIFFKCEGGFCVVESDGTDDTFWSSNPCGPEYWSLSPDATSLAFSCRGSDDQPGGTYVLNADTFVAARVDTFQFPPVAPSWSPDGSKVAFGCHPDSNGYTGICLANRDGSDVNEIWRKSNEEASEPAWGPPP